jgi:shikimate dehydrogenase
MSSCSKRGTPRTVDFVVTRKAGVLGHPIAHSLSPVLHRAAYEALGLDWTYEAYDVESGGLGDFLKRVDREWAGLSLTMPLKIEAVPLMDFIEPLAKLLGVVNTVVVSGRDASVQLVGANTDVHGIVAAVREARTGAVSSGMVIGGGATAISAVSALGEMGCTESIVAVRSRARAGGLLRAATAMGLGVRFVDIADDRRIATALNSSDVTISTVPASAGATLSSSLGGLTLEARPVLLDVVYDPLVTPLASAWIERGGTVVGGERMLLHQASEQVRLMTGRAAPLEAMDTALRAVLPSS